jgi:UDP-N-acetylmuramate--alanine ligase
MFVPDIAEMPSLILQSVQDGDVVMTMGAGSIGNVAQKVVQASSGGAHVV